MRRLLAAYREWRIRRLYGRYERLHHDLERLIAEEQARRAAAPSPQPDAEPVPDDGQPIVLLRFAGPIPVLVAQNVVPTPDGRAFIDRRHFTKESE